MRSWCCRLQRERQSNCRGDRKMIAANALRKEGKCMFKLFARFDHVDYARTYMHELFLSSVIIA